MELKLLNIYRPRAFARYRNIYADVVLRQQVGYLFRPLDKAVGARVKIFLVAHIQCLAFVFKAIKVEVKNFLPRTDIFVYNGKGGAGSRLGNAQVFANGFDERGFARTHISIKKKDTGISRKVHNFGRSGRELGYGG